MELMLPRHHAASIVAALLVVVLGSAVVNAAPATIDTSMPGWTWSGMQPYDDEN